MTPPPREATDAPVTPVARPGLLLLVLCLAQFMLVLDVSVTNVALASVRADLDFAVEDLQWIITAYTLVFGSLLIFSGRAGDLWGRRRLFLVGTAVFTAASLACGLAQEPWQLITARAAQGLGAAMMSPAALSLLTTAFREGPARNRALGVWGAVSAGGAAAGMIIGGVLTDLAGWRWVFLINVPVGLAIALAAPRVVAESRSGGRTRLDVPGAITVTAGLLALVLGLTRIETGAPGSPVAPALLVLAGLLLVVFVAIERRSPAPLVDFALLRSRSVGVANAFAVLSTAVVVGQSFFLSLHLREMLGYSPLRTGFALVPITLVVIAVAGAVPRLLPAVGVRPVLVTAGLALAGGMALQSRMPVDGTYVADVLPAILLTAAGLGLGFVAATIAATSGVPARHQGLASGLLNTSQQVGGAIGLAVLATVAAARTEQLLGTGEAPLPALNGGFSAGLVVAIGFAVVAALVALAAPGRVPPPAPDPAAAAAAALPVPGGSAGAPPASPSAPAASDARSPQ
jgi:EmrB/QacA subfamily drug resistance transporter